MTLAEIIKPIISVGFSNERDSEFCHVLKKDNVHVEITEVHGTFKVTAYKTSDVEFLPLITIRTGTALNSFIDDVKIMGGLT